jgi:putative SOS response-associated peptidase YedK
MCKRFVQAFLPSEVAEQYGAQESARLAPVLTEARSKNAEWPRFNVAPMQNVLAITVRNNGMRKLETFEWGFKPHWSTDLPWVRYPKRPLWPKRGEPIINAPSENVANRAFSEAFEKRRCIIPASAYYEWQPVGKARQPYVIRRRDREPLAFAGLWEEWCGGGQTLRTCAILTTTANALLAPIHDRMPMILSTDGVAAWLTPFTPLTELRELLTPCADEELEAYTVAPTVGNPHIDDPSLLEPWQPSWSRKQ